MKVATLIGNFQDKRKSNWKYCLYVVSEPFPSNEGRYNHNPFILPSQFQISVSEPFPSNEGRYVDRVIHLRLILHGFRTFSF